MPRIARPQKLSSGTYRIRWRDDQGRQQSETYAEWNEARKALARHQAEIEAIKTGQVAPPPPRKTFDDLEKHWVATKGAAKRNPKDDASILRAHLRPAFGGLDLAEITYEKIEEFKAERLHLAKSTLRNLLNLLGAMLKHAVRLRWLRPDQMPHIDRPSVRALHRQYSYLRTTGEIQRFLAAAKEGDADGYVLYATAIFTGLRQGELAALRWDRVDFQMRLLTVDASFDGPTKPDDIRYVPIPDVLLPILREWRLRCPGLLVFPNRAGNMHQPCAEIFVGKFHAVLDTAGFPKPDPGTKGKQKHYIRFHDLRHTYASHYMMNGGDLFRLQKLLGHKSADMTLRYAHLTPNAFQADYGRFNHVGIGDPADVRVLPAPSERRGRRSIP